jgi:hypothetical protein
MPFAELKKQSKLGSLTKKLVEKLEKTSSSGTSADERFWRPTMGKEGVGTAVIRFLPAPDGEDDPFVSLYHHAFQGPSGQWYIENSLTTIGKKDPVSEYNRSIWDTDKAFVQGGGKKSGSKRKLNYFSNVYVVKDPANPENEGKVFLFKYGTKIFDKIADALHPQEGLDLEEMDPFDLWNGSNFKLRVVMKDGYWNYDKSEFSTPGPLSSDDDEMEEIWKKCYSLAAIVAPDQFKSYEDLQKRLNMILGLENETPTPSRKPVSESVEEEEDVLEELERVSKQKKSKVSSDSEEDEDMEEFFKGLLDEDE